MIFRRKSMPYCVIPPLEEPRQFQRQTKWPKNGISHQGDKACPIVARVCGAVTSEWVSWCHWRPSVRQGGSSPTKRRTGAWRVRHPGKPREGSRRLIERPARCRRGGGARAKKSSSSSSSSCCCGQPRWTGVAQAIERGLGRGH